MKSRVVTGGVEGVAHGGNRNFIQTGLAMLRQTDDARAIVGALGSAKLCSRMVMSPEGKLNAAGVGRAGAGAVAGSTPTDFFLKDDMLVLILGSEIEVESSLVEVFRNGSRSVLDLVDCHSRKTVESRLVVDVQGT